MGKEVVYYPTIEFYDETWLKTSLCLWDKIYRIVPDSYKPKDSDEVIIAIDNGLVENIILNKNDLARTAELFESYLEDAKIVPAAVEGWDNINVRLHPEKVDDRILPILEGMAKKFDPNGFLLMSAYLFRHFKRNMLLHQAWKNLMEEKSEQRQWSKSAFVR